jgi:hypothetical protein
MGGGGVLMGVLLAEKGDQDRGKTSVCHRFPLENIISFLFLFANILRFFLVPNIVLAPGNI